ncbi:hypothetical protein Tco_1097770, partial [Tanacetum coccineum]
GGGNGKTSKPTRFRRRLHGDSCDDSLYEVCKESESNTNDEYVLVGSSYGNTDYGNDVIPSKVTIGVDNATSNQNCSFTFVMSQVVADSTCIFGSSNEFTAVNTHTPTSHVDAVVIFGVSVMSFEELNALVNKLEADDYEFKGMHIDEQNAVIGEINILWEKYLATGFSNPINTDGPGPGQSVTIPKKVSFAEAVGASTKMDHATNTHNVKGDNTIPSHDTPIIQSTSIQEPVLDLRAAGGVASTLNEGSTNNMHADPIVQSISSQCKPSSYVVAAGGTLPKPTTTGGISKPNFHLLYPDNLYEGVNVSIPRKVVETVSTRYANTLYGYFI